MSGSRSGTLEMSAERLAGQPTAFHDRFLAGRVVLIAGGGSGMGRATAYLATRLGADVMICGRRLEKLEQTADEIRQLLGKEIAFARMTVREPSQVHDVLDDAFDRFGHVDHLVNSAGGQFPAPALDYSTNAWNAIIDTNLNGTWHLMQGMAARWRDRGARGSIVNIVLSYSRGFPQSAPSCAARAAVVYLSKSVAVEWAPLGIRVNCLAPGSVASEGTDNYAPEVRARLDGSNPMQRLGDVWEIAQGIVFLAAETGSFVTGECLFIDGGTQLWGPQFPLGVPAAFGPDPHAHR